MHVDPFADSFRFETKGPSGPGRWLDLIHAVNRAEHGAIGQPTSTGKWWAGGYVEEYGARFRVIFHDDETTTVVAKTTADAYALREAARTLDADPAEPTDAAKEGKRYLVTYTTAPLAGAEAVAVLTTAATPGSTEFASDAMDAAATAAHPEPITLLGVEALTTVTEW